MAAESKKQRDYRKPPPEDEVSRKLLFRQLIRRPRPSKKIAYRIEGVEHIPLRVVGLRGLEDIEAFETIEDLEDFMRAPIGNSLVLAELVTRALWIPTGRAFQTAEQVLRLTTRELGDLGNAVWKALGEVSPAYHRCDLTAWRTALKEGAQHRTNINEAAIMSSCSEYAGMSGVPIGHADRYYGIPACELTDGQIMAFNAATELVRDLTRADDG